MSKETPTADPSSTEVLRAAYVVQKAEADRRKTVVKSLVAAHEAASGADDQRVNPLVRSPDFKEKLFGLISEAKVIAALAIADKVRAQKKLETALGRRLTEEET